MKFLPRVCDPSLFSRLPGTQFPVSMVHSGNSISKLATEQYYIWYEMAMVQNTYGTKWLWCKIRMNFIIYSCLYLYYVVKELHTNL
jgi:hypothetical protein